MDNKKLFIGNVGYDTTVEALVEVASKYGKVVDSYKPLGKGFGFLTFETEEQALAAKEGLNGFELEGRALNVDFAKPRDDSKPRGSFGGGRRDFRRNDSRGGNDRRGGFGSNRY